ncbi:ribonuclease Y-like [Montipora capricornis]|uniref:ribonuclease Y-like n=1 Tax=Montipora capricornis TaxID=246305 RepID=UPI0035F1F9AC
MADTNYQDLKDSIDALTKVVTEGFATIHADMDKLRIEFKADLDEVRGKIRELESSLTYSQEEFNRLSEKAVKTSEQHEKAIATLTEHIAQLEQQLKEEVENNIKLEQYTRRENLRFNNIKESEGENCKSVITNIIQNELGADVTQIRFHAVHRVGKRVEGKNRPIIARFVSREDRDTVWSKKGKMKSSSSYTDAYITEDYARAIQLERRALIKAMMKARDEQGIQNATVRGRYLIINNERYDHKSIPEYLK